MQIEANHRLEVMDRLHCIKCSALLSNSDDCLHHSCLQVTPPPIKPGYLQVELQTNFGHTLYFFQILSPQTIPKILDSLNPLAIPFQILKYFWSGVLGAIPGDFSPLEPASLQEYLTIHEKVRKEGRVCGPLTLRFPEFKNFIPRFLEHHMDLGFVYQIASSSNPSNPPFFHEYGSFYSEWIGFFKSPSQYNFFRVLLFNLPQDLLGRIWILLNRSTKTQLLSYKRVLPAHHQLFERALTLS